MQSARSRARSCGRETGRPCGAASGWASGPLCHIGGMGRDRDDRLPAKPTRVELAREEDLPVVARLVVEIRSDGRRTVARGAMEDTATGQGVAVEARGDSPMKLAL